MKKLILSCIFLLICIFALWCDNPWEQVYDIYSSPVGEYAYRTVLDDNGRPIIGQNNEYVKQLIFRDFNVYYFDGFDFSKENDATTPLLRKNQYEIDAIIKDLGNKDKVHPAGEEPYSIIGHSQGGLRALGYLTQLKKEPNSKELLDQIDAVITVSGAIQGQKIIDNIPKRGKDLVNKLNNGIAATAYFADLVSVLIHPVLLPIGIFVKNLLSQSNLNLAVDVWWAISPEIIGSFWREIWYDPELKNVHEIRDMKPGSDYIKENVFSVEQSEVVVKKLISEKKVLKWVTEKNKKGKNIKVLRLVTEKKYSYNNVPEFVPKFDPNVPVGFIVGDNNDIFSMFEKDVRETTKKVINGLTIAFGFAETLHCLKCVGIIGLFDGSVTRANDTHQARCIMNNINSEYHALIGSSKNDGFIAIESQYLPRDLIDPNNGDVVRVNLNTVLMVRENTDGYVRVEKASHNNIMKQAKTYETAHKMIVEAREKRIRDGLR